jgi:hypothetical protein
MAVTQPITVVASDGNSGFTNLTGTIAGVGAGQMASFNVRFTGDGMPHSYDLLFERGRSGVVLGSIPVTIVGNDYQYRVVAVDADNDPITLSLVTVPAGAAISSTVVHLSADATLNSGSVGEATVDWLPPAAYRDDRGHYWIVEFKGGGIDSVYRQHQLRLTKDQRIRRLGADDFLLRIPKPQRPAWMDRQTYASLAAELVVREVEVKVRQRGFRVQQLTLVTTLLDPTHYRADELASVYRARWNAELDLRSIKVTMQMDVLRCKKPEMVRKEIWMHLLGYNLIQTVMADAAQRHGCKPREISFKGTLQTLSAYRHQVETVSADVLPALYEELLVAVACHRVGNRPDRYEPRAVKRRPKPHDLLTVPREEAKRHLAA